ncbi:MAG: DNA mismatch repair protein MutS [Bacillota bacterium]|nr:DNA mismatch repair protein MutS [Bacillota bacterium]
MIKVRDERYPLMSKYDWDQLTPMLRQYYEIKSKYLDYILFYRLGDFYEMFLDDAVQASKALEITLTTRGGVGDERVPLCGVPFHSVDLYLKRAIERGLSIAICEQMEDPALAKGIVRRDVIRIITPGTIFDPEMLDSVQNNFIASIYRDREGYGLTHCDISTGKIKTTTLTSYLHLLQEIERIQPSEIIYDPENLDESTIQKFAVKGYCTTKYSQYGAVEPGSQIRFDSVDSTSLLLGYLAYTSKQSLGHIGEPEYYSDRDKLLIDANSMRNLELTENMRTKEKKGSLLWVLDRTRTAMGARLLRSSLIEPLIEISHINRRLDAVDYLFNETIARADLIDALDKIYDLERLTTKIVYGSVNPRDLIAIRNSLAVLPEMKRCLAADGVPELLVQLGKELQPLADIRAMIETAIVPEPPAHTRDGGFIASGYHAELDEIRAIALGGKDWIQELEAAEKEKSGIRTLKVGYNRVFGYYFEVSKSFSSSVPEYFIRKQTLANSERFITPELKNLEEKVLGAEDRILRLELALYEQILDRLRAVIETLRRNADRIAKIDMLAAFAEVSFQNGYRRPTVNTGDRLHIQNGRHPVIERMFDYIPNDTEMDGGNSKIHILTGPNMAGKSSYLRQTVLIVLMAQIGCFVPATAADIGVFDRVFTRVGASDDLSQGQSTFMVEMSELAYILENATDRSMIILDEIGRGTSTYDGLSIAWSVLEYLSKRHAKVMFATHYHELTELQGKLEGVLNYRIAVRKSGDDIVFLRKIVQGGETQSYGIEVAKLAGVPEEVIAGAKCILTRLEQNELGANPAPGAASVREMPILPVDPRTETALSIVDAIEHAELDQMTPLQAMLLLSSLRDQIRTTT